MARPKENDVVGWSPAKKETTRETSDRIIKSMQDNAGKANEQGKRGKS